MLELLVTVSYHINGFLFFSSDNVQAPFERAKRAFPQCGKTGFADIPVLPLSGFEVLPGTEILPKLMAAAPSESSLTI